MVCTTYNLSNNLSPITYFFEWKLPSSLMTARFRVLLPVWKSSGWIWFKYTYLGWSIRMGFSSIICVMTYVHILHWEIFLISSANGSYPAGSFYGNVLSPAYFDVYRFENIRLDPPNRIIYLFDEGEIHIFQLIMIFAFWMIGNMCFGITGRNAAAHLDFESIKTCCHYSHKISFEAFIVAMKGFVNFYYVMYFKRFMLLMF